MLDGSPSTLDEVFLAMGPKPEGVHRKYRPWKRLGRQKGLMGEHYRLVASGLSGFQHVGGILVVVAGGIPDRIVCYYESGHQGSVLHLLRAKHFALHNLA